MVKSSGNMTMFEQFISNKIVIVALIAWVTAQGLKVITHACVYKKLDFKRLFGDGGMPSCHSAVVSSCATAIGIIEGFNSSVFALALIIAIIVMHDASGVRFETGKQNKIIKDISQFIEGLNNIKFDDESLKEFVGHTHLQVVMGCLLGVIVSVIVCNILFIQAHICGLFF